MEDSVEITSSSSYTSFSSRSNGVLEIDMDRLPRYNPPRNPIASPAPSIGSSPCLSNGFHSRISNPHTSSRFGPNSGNTRLSNLIVNLEKMLNDKEWDYSDADVVVDDISVGVVRFLLASSSSFFHELFQPKSPTGEVRPKFYMSELVPNGKVGYDAFLLLLGYLYTGNLKSYPREVSTCVDDHCIHDACHPAIDFQLQLLYASATFQIDELISLLQTDLLNIVEKALVEDVTPILVAAFHCKLNLLQYHCIKRVSQSDTRYLWIERELPFELSREIILRRREDGTTAVMELSERRVKRIYKALDTDDVDLLELLLMESATTLDAVYGLHYAVTYCEPKVVSEILLRCITNVNLCNPRGYTVLHMAARRMNPFILLSLLSKGARASDCTSDGQSAVSICRRMIRPREYIANVQEGVETNKARLCVDALEREMQRNSTSVDMLPPTPDVDTELRQEFVGNRDNMLIEFF